ncbi:MAG: hypothetical protein JKY95_18605 [Planctomycetaceae bacterium]|nr:hypothetical protein [Planctomycetaceae bacterium]MBL4886522.1 hypothetical protein [Planctomycetaceae bacterium]
MGSKKKKRKKSNVDSAQLVKGVFIFAVLVGVVYFFNNLGGNDSSSNTSVVSLAPARAIHNNGGVQAEGNGHQQSSGQDENIVQPFKPIIDPSKTEEMTPDPVNESPVMSKSEAVPFAGSGGFKVKDTPTEAGLPDDKSPGMSRDNPKIIIGTEQGNQLLAEITEMGFSIQIPDGFDSAGFMKQTIQKHAELVMDKAKIRLSTDSSVESAPFMVVTVLTMPQENGAPDALKVFIQATVTGVDSEGKPGTQYVTLWENQNTDLGLVSSQAVDQGVIPKRLGEKMTSFFNKFHSVHSRAIRSLK